MSTASDLAVSAKAFAFNDQTEISAVIYELASQAGLLSMTPSELAAASKCYCFDEGTARGVIAYLLAVKAGLQTTTPADLAKLAKCFCFDRDTWKKVVVYLLESGGGGTTVQDMQVAWTPTNVALGSLIGFVSDPTFGADSTLSGITNITFNQTSMAWVDIEGANDLLTVSAPNLVNINTQADGYFAIQGCAAITSVDLPLLQTCITAIDIRSCPNLVSINIPHYLPTVGRTIHASGCGLSAATVNMFLARCVAVPTWGNAGENLLLQGGTNAAPSGQGVADKATLIGRGAVVNTN